MLKINAQEVPQTVTTVRAKSGEALNLVLTEDQVGVEIMNNEQRAYAFISTEQFQQMVIPILAHIEEQRPRLENYFTVDQAEEAAP